MLKRGWRKRARSDSERDDVEWFTVCLKFWDGAVEEATKRPWSVENLTCSYDAEHTPPLVVFRGNFNDVEDVANARFRFTHVHSPDMERRARSLVAAGFAPHRQTSFGQIDDEEELRGLEMHARAKIARIENLLASSADLAKRRAVLDDHLAEFDAKAPDLVGDSFAGLLETRSRLVRDVEKATTRMREIRGQTVLI